MPEFPSHVPAGLATRTPTRLARKVKPIHTLAAIGLLLSSAATAEPTWKKDLTPAKPGTFPRLAPCVIDYQLSWKGMLNAGAMRMEFAPKDTKKPGSLVVRSSANSLGAAAALFPYTSNSWSELDPVSLRPKFFQGTETDHKKTATTTNRYFPDRVESTELTKPLKKNTVTRKQHNFTASPVFDIFSAMLHIRSQKLANGDQITLLIHPFDNPYLLRVKVLGREVHQNRNTIKLSVGMRKIDRKTLELKPYKKLKSDATLWLSDDADRIPVEFRAAVFIGDVRATLGHFQKPKP
jgi:hypothetical protein